MSSYFSLVFGLHLRPLPSGAEAETAASYYRAQPVENKEMYWRCRQEFGTGCPDVCPIPGHIQGDIGWGLEQSGLAEGVPAQGRGLEQDDL